MIYVFCVADCGYLMGWHFYDGDDGVWVMGQKQTQVNIDDANKFQNIFFKIQLKCNAKSFAYELCINFNSTSVKLNKQYCGFAKNLSWFHKDLLNQRCFFFLQMWTLLNKSSFF